MKAYAEYRNMGIHDLESDKRKLEAYMRYCTVEKVREACQERINAIINEIDLREETEVYNGKRMDWKQGELFE